MYNKKNVQSGCHKTVGKHYMRSLRYLPVLLAMVGVTAYGQTPPDDRIVDVKIYFDGSCPKSVDRMEVDVKSNPPQKVRWTAYNADGSAPAPTVSFSIYFDPFVGATNADPNVDGVVTSKPVSAGVPINVVYKYTIVGSGCATPLDPRIRVV